MKEESKGGNKGWRKGGKKEGLITVVITRNFQVNTNGCIYSTTQNRSLFLLEYSYLASDKNVFKRRQRKLHSETNGMQL